MKIALITGGTGGPGTAMCTRLTAGGYQVIANHLPSLSDTARKWQVSLAATGTQCELAAADMVKAIPDAHRQAIIDAIPVGRIGQPDDVANAVSFLASERSGYITGIELSVNGGVYIH